MTGTRSSWQWHLRTVSISQPKIPRPLCNRFRSEGTKRKRQDALSSVPWESPRGQGSKWWPQHSRAPRWRSDPGSLNLIYTSFLSFMTIVFRERKYADFWLRVMELANTANLIGKHISVICIDGTASWVVLPRSDTMLYTSGCCFRWIKWFRPHIVRLFPAFLLASYLPCLLPTYTRLTGLGTASLIGKSSIISRRNFITRPGGRENAIHRWTIETLRFTSGVSSNPF